MADAKGKATDGRRHPRRPTSGFSLVAYKTQAASAYARRKNIGEAVLKRVLAQLDGKILIENPPRLEGRNMSMQIAGKPGAFPKKEKPKVVVDGKEQEQEEEDLPDMVDEDEDDEGDEGAADVAASPPTTTA